MRWFIRCNIGALSIPRASAGSRALVRTLGEKSIELVASKQGFECDERNLVLGLNLSVKKPETRLHSTLYDIYVFHCSQGF